MQPIVFSLIDSQRGKGWSRKGKNRIRLADEMHLLFSCQQPDSIYYFISFKIKRLKLSSLKIKHHSHGTAASWRNLVILSDGIVY